MFKREFRLPKNVRFNKENQVFSKFLFIKVSENKVNLKRFGIVVSKRVDKRAVIRNKIKRQIRSCIEENEKNVPVGKDILIIVMPNIKDKQKKEICDSIEKLFKKIK